MMANVNGCDQNKLFENISKYMILSDHLNEYVYNRLINFVVLPTLTSNNLWRRIHHFHVFPFGKYLSKLLDKRGKIILRLKQSGKYN